MTAFALPQFPGVREADSAVKQYCDGTHRLIPPEKTVERLRGLLPLLGITRVANVTGLDYIGIPVVMVCRPNSRALSVSQGKGVNLAAAKASGMMESVEAFHAERVDLPLRMGSFREIHCAHPTVDIERIPRPSDSQFSEHYRTLWVAGTDLLSGDSRWLPFEAVHTDFCLPYPEGSGAFFQSSNGLSSGNHILEAISHGICELVERDASALWEASGEEFQRGRRIDLATVTDPACLSVLARYGAANVAVAVWETTSDIALPCFDCLIIDRELNPLRPLPAAFGAGCHPALEVALSRALTEAAQSRLTSISGSRDDIDWTSHSYAHEWEILCQLHEFIAGQSGSRSFPVTATRFSATLNADVEYELECLRGVGVEEVLVVDLTRTGLEIPVVKVVIPGIETSHRIAGYLPGPRARAAAAHYGSV